MRLNFKKNLKKNSIDKKDKKILMLIILVQCIFITSVFCIKKQGYHSDEIWNYGLSNSSEGKNIYCYNDGTPKNNNKWLDSKILLEYISVDRDERFDYKSVYNNSAADLNPPFQYMLLHLVCSFFPNVWSKWFCFVINIIAFAITQLFLYKTFRELGCEKNIYFAGILMYGFGMGAVNVAIFLRIYAVGTLLSAMFLYYSIKIFNQNKKKENISKLDCLKLFISGLLGALTLHQFLIIAFIITFMYSLYYLIKKQYKTMIIYGTVNTLSVVVSMVVFPSTIAHVFCENSVPIQNAQAQASPPLLFQFVRYFEYICRDIIGIHFEAQPGEVHSIVSMSVGVLAGLFFLICYINRKKEAIIKMKEKLEFFIKRFVSEIKIIGFSVMTIAVSVVFFILVVSKMTSIVNMGDYSRRYIFIIYPLFCILIVLLINCCFFNKDGCVKKCNGRSFIAAYACLLAFAFFSHVFADKSFYFEKDSEGITFDELEEDADCIVVLSRLWIFTCAANELYDTGSLYLTDQNEYIQSNYEFDAVNHHVYLLLDVSNEYDGDEEFRNVYAESGYMVNKDEILNYYESLSISSQCTLVGTDYLFDKKVEIYRLN